MARPHIEFIQHQDLSFAPVSMSGEGAATEVGLKCLSVDDERGASTTLVQFPAGWERAETGHYLVDHELYVLSGDLTISGVRYTEHTYAFLPAGYAHAHSSSARGAVALTFFGGRRQWVPGEAPTGMLDERRLVRYLNQFEHPWTGNFHPQFPIGA